MLLGHVLVVSLDALTLHRQGGCGDDAMAKMSMVAMLLGFLAGCAPAMPELRDAVDRAGYPQPGARRRPAVAPVADGVTIAIPPTVDTTQDAMFVCEWRVADHVLDCDYLVPWLREYDRAKAATPPIDPNHSTSAPMPPGVMAL